MGTVINEVGSSAGGIAKVEYKDEAGNVLWYYDDAGNFVRNGNQTSTIFSHDGAVKKHTGLRIGETPDVGNFLILLTPVWKTGLVGLSMIRGKFDFDRGAATAANRVKYTEINIKTANDSNFLKSFDSDVTFLGTVDYKGVKYYCLYNMGIDSSVVVNFEGVFKTTDSTITVPTLISNYETNALISNLTQIDSSKIISNGFIKRFTAGAENLLSTIPLTIKKSSTTALDVQDDSSVSAFKVDSTNKVVTSYNQKVMGLAGTGNRAVYSDATGALTNTSSDARVKKNIENIADNMNVLGVLKQIRGVTYNWDNTIEGYEGAGEQQEIGVIAQEIEQFIPQVVGENSTGYKSVDYAKMVAYLIEVNKALLAKIEVLEAKVM